MKRWMRKALTGSAMLALATMTLLSVGGAGSTALAGDDDRILVAVVAFDTSPIRNTWHYNWDYQNLGFAAADSMTTALFKTGRFRMIERQHLDKVLAEQDLGESGRLDPTTAARIGKILGVQMMIIGSVTQYGLKEQGGRIPQIGRWKWGRGIGGKIVTTEVGLTCRLIDTTTAEILAVAEAHDKHRFGKGEFAGASLGTSWDSGAASKTLENAVSQLAQKLADGAAGIKPSTVRGGLVGKIAKVSGSTVYINLGDASGVKVGDRFTVLALGEAIIDPDTGENLGGIESEIGEIEVTKIINAKLSLARVVSGSGLAAGNKIAMK